VADAGWYPDPGGSGQFRYWDGRGWSAALSPHPAAPPPGPGAPGGQRSSRRPVAAIIGIVALVVAVAVVLLFVLRPWQRVDDITNNPPVSTVSPGADGATPTPTPTPTEPTPTPSPTPTESTATPQGDVACPQGDPSARDAHPSDGRVHGGGLSFASIPDWVPDYGSSGISFAYDVASDGYSLTPTWFAMSAVGAVRIADGFENPKQAAIAITQCVSTSDFYSSMISAAPVHSKAVTIDGHAGWSVRTKILCNVEGYPDITGDVVDVIVVDVGDGESLGMYLGTATIDDAYTTDAMETAITSLRVER